MKPMLLTAAFRLLWLVTPFLVIQQQSALAQAPFSPFNLFESLFVNSPLRNNKRPSRHLRRPSSSFLRAPTSTPFKASPTIPPHLDAFQQSSVISNEVKTTFSSGDVKTIFPSTEIKSSSLPISGGATAQLVFSKPEFFREPEQIVEPFTGSVRSYGNTFTVSSGPVDTFRSKPTFQTTVGEFRTYPTAAPPTPSTAFPTPSTTVRSSDSSFRQSHSTFNLPSSFVEIIDDTPLNSRAPAGQPIDVVPQSLNHTTTPAPVYFPLDPIVDFPRSEFSGPNPGQFSGGLTAETVLSSNLFYDELLAPHTETRYPVAPVNPYYSPEEFKYHQSGDDSLLDSTAQDSRNTIENESLKDGERNELNIVPRGIIRDETKNELDEDDIRKKSGGKIDNRVRGNGGKLEDRARGARDQREFTINKAEEDINLGNRFLLNDLPIKKKQQSKKLDCGGANDLGFCSMTSDYPKEDVEAILRRCPHVTESFSAVISEDLEELGDNSEFVSLKNEQGPWSWKVYTYKKKQVCNSQLSFIRPGVALDTKGDWFTIVQTDYIQQKVGIDMCTKPNSPCPGVESCGSKSRCVQRYNYQLLLAVNTLNRRQCPTIRAFKFPSGCVCHMEV